MKFIIDLLRILAFDSRALRRLAENRTVWCGVLFLSAGYLAFMLIRNSVYAVLQESGVYPTGRFDRLVQTNLPEALIFLSLVYVPALILLGNSISGHGLGFSISKQEYEAHISALFPLWGLLFLVAAPMQRLAPQFLVLGGGVFGISIGLLVLFTLMLVYSIWAFRELNFVSMAAATAIFVLSGLTLPVFYFLTAFFFALPIFIMIPLLYLGYQRLRGYFSSQSGERVFQQHLHLLTLNPQDADAHHQLGLIHLKRRNFDAAARYFDNAIRIEGADPDYHYYRGRVHELLGEWPQALEQYEATYRLSPEYGLGDIFREVGKAYLLTGNAQKGMEFLNFFLQNRGSDPEGRYWLAVGYRDLGDFSQMRIQLHLILEQARSNPRFFRKEHREWIFRARSLLKQEARSLNKEVRSQETEVRIKKP
jgi:tetratricopeptide (TPR) repeat protein